MGTRHRSDSALDVSPNDHLVHLEKEGFEVGELAYSSIVGWAVKIDSRPVFKDGEWRVNVLDSTPVEDVLVSNLYPEQMLLNEIHDIQCEMRKESILTESRIDLIVQRLNIIHMGLTAIGDYRDKF